MRSIILIAISLLAFTHTRTIQAQVSVNVNIGVPPLWGPYGYDEARYYYLPDIDVYYDIWEERYIYCDRGRWIYMVTLPPRFAYYDFYRGYKVVLDYCGASPYRYWNRHRADYYGYRNYRGPQQYTYRDQGGRPRLESHQYQRRAQADTYRGNGGDRYHDGNRKSGSYDQRPTERNSGPAYNDRGRNERPEISNDRRNGNNAPVYKDQGRGSASRQPEMNREHRRPSVEHRSVEPRQQGRMGGGERKNHSQGNRPSQGSRGNGNHGGGYGRGSR